MAKDLLIRASGSDVFDLLIFELLLLLLSLNLLLQHLYFLALDIGVDTPKSVGLVRQYNFLVVTNP